MKSIFFYILLSGLSVSSVMAQKSCLDPENLKNLDSQWEKALLDSDAEFLESLLADDFIWVHNHASMVDSKEALLKRASNPNVRATGDTKSRVSKDVKAIVLGSTGVVIGITIVDRGPTPTTYHFMRTYTVVDGKCYLLANHTMAIPDIEE